MTELIKVLYYEAGKQPEVKIIKNTLEAMQELVQGHIEVVPHDEIAGCFYVCNENGKNEDLLANCWIYGGRDYIAGNFFVCRTEGEDMASIGDEDIDRLIGPAWRSAMEVSSE